MATTSTSRGSSWSDNEVRALISIWGEDRIQEELDGAVRNQATFNSIAKKMEKKDMSEIGSNVEIKSKIKKKSIDKSRIIMDKLGEGGKHASTTKN